MKEYVKDESDWARVAKSLASDFKPGHRIALKGDLGVGKTSLVRALLRQWGWTEAVPSPSYPLLLEYEVPPFRVIHIDAFRLQADQPMPWDPNEWRDAVVFVEWPERTRLEPYHFEVEIRQLEDGREFLMKAFDPLPASGHS